LENFHGWDSTQQYLPVIIAKGDFETDWTRATLDFPKHES